MQQFETYTQLRFLELCSPWLFYFTFEFRYKYKFKKHKNPTLFDEGSSYFLVQIKKIKSTIYYYYYDYYYIKAKIEAAEEVKWQKNLHVFNFTTRLAIV